jgi:PAS domain S-box-containing protein
MQKLHDKYTEILNNHLAEPTEANLFKGYSFGKMCAQKGIPMTEVVSMHFAALKSGQVPHADVNLPDAQSFLLETTLAMSVSGGLKTMEHVLAALYDETIEQFKELCTIKEELKNYSQNLEEQVQIKLRELQTSEEGFAILVQTIPDIVYKTDPEGRFVYLNSAVRQLGYEPSELVGRHFSEIVLPGEIELVCSSFVLPRYRGRQTGDDKAPKLFDERRSGSRKTVGLEVRLLLNSGKTIPGLVEPLGREILVVEVNSSGLHEYNPETGKKEYIGTVGVIRDITERKRYENEINKYHLQLEEMVENRTAELSQANKALQAEISDRKHSEKFVKGILEGMEEGLLVVAPDYRIITANRAYARRVKMPLEKIIGQHCHTVSHQRERPGGESDEKRAVQLVLASGRSQEVLHQHWDQTNHPVQALIKGYPMKDSRGEITSVILIINDQTEQRRLEDQLRQAQKMEAVGTLAGGIAHDFNNILAAIIGYTQLACQELPSESAPRQDLQESLKAASRAKDLVKQILTFSRQTDQERSPLALGPIVKEGLQLLRASLPVTIDIHPHLAEDLKPVAADPTQIHQVLVNLCANAAQAMASGSGKLEITLQQVAIKKGEIASHPDLRPGSYVKLSVGDNGTGMPSSIKKRIFEPYFTTKEKEKGTGLGLAVVHGIVKSHQGAIEVESEPGIGSVFHVYLPVIEEVLPAPDSQPLQKMPAGQETILLIEDEAPLLKVLQRLLTSLGYRVVACTDSTEAVTIFTREPARFDLVITDMTMPKMAGDELSARILALRPAMPIILCTGYSEQMSMDKAAELGIRKFVYKPVELTELAAMVREVLDRMKN